MATSRISSLVMMQPLKSFKPCCLKRSFDWLLTPGCFGRSDTLTKTQSVGLSCVFAVSSLPAIVVDGSTSFSFPGYSLIRIVSSTTQGSVSQVHDFTYDKSVPYLFSTPQARSQQETEILTHLLTKLALVNDISGVMYLVDPMWIYSPRMWEGLQF